MTGANNPGFREKISYQALLLGGFSLLATALLVVGDLVTNHSIQERTREDLLASLSQVIPTSQYDNDLLKDPLLIKPADGLPPVTVYRGTRGQAVSALAWEISGQGYSGEIRLLLAVDAEGKILGVRVLSHAETPGLGDKIELEKDNWILGFNGLSLGNPPQEKWKVKTDGGEFDSFSGATITPRGVVKAIAEGLSFFKDHRGELLQPPSSTEQQGTSR